MKYAVMTENAAQVDITEAYLWIARDSSENAIRWVEAVEAAIESLDTFPERCAVAPESEEFDREIRQLLHGNYRILFTIHDETVHVLHVRHGARRPAKPETPGAEPE